MRVHPRGIRSVEEANKKKREKKRQPECNNTVFNTLIQNATGLK